jgi:hypothetical protein
VARAEVGQQPGALELRRWSRSTSAGDLRNPQNPYRRGTRSAILGVVIGNRPRGGSIIADIDVAWMVVTGVVLRRRAPAADA